MTNALIAIVCIMLLGIVIYIRIWWDGPGISLKFTKWFFVIFAAASLIVGAITYFMS